MKGPLKRLLVTLITVFGAITVIFGLQIVIVVYLAATMVMRGEFTVGMLFAVMLYRRHMGGETIEDLALGMTIPAERVSQRIRAAAAFCEAR